jgi:catechol 2,3-dioxygenase-like lactoylglutathione lyase family enzyme
MLTAIHPKLPMRNKAATKDYYLNKLGFSEIGDYGDYLMVKKEDVEIHFFKFKKLKPKKNYGMVYIRTNAIAALYQTLLERKVLIHPNAPLETKSWGQQEFSLLDPDNNLLTFGQPV